jgi:hypothetical protein
MKEYSRAALMPIETSRKSEKQNYGPTGVKNRLHDFPAANLKFNVRALKITGSLVNRDSIIFSVNCF